MKRLAVGTHGVLNVPVWIPCQYDRYVPRYSTHGAPVGTHGISVCPEQKVPIEGQDAEQANQEVREAPGEFIVALIVFSKPLSSEPEFIYDLWRLKR
jgi:hypothetical protein